MPKKLRKMLGDVNAPSTNKWNCLERKPHDMPGAYRPVPDFPIVYEGYPFGVPASSFKYEGRLPHYIFSAKRGFRYD